VGGFAPEIEDEIVKVESADLMIWQFPLWWFALPAILKGWVDRVFAMGRTYGGGHVYETGRFSGKRALLSLTTGGPEAAYRNDGFNGDLGAMLRPIHRGILNFTGFAVLAPQVVYGPVRADDAQRAGWLADWTGGWAGSRTSRRSMSAGTRPDDPSAVRESIARPHSPDGPDGRASAWRACAG